MWKWNLGTLFSLSSSSSILSPYFLLILFLAFSFFSLSLFLFLWYSPPLSLSWFLSLWPVFLFLVIPSLFELRGPVIIIKWNLKASSQPDRYLSDWIGGVALGNVGGPGLLPVTMVMFPRFLWTFFPDFLPWGDVSS